MQADGRIALWQQLQHAAQVVQAVMQGSNAPTALDAVPPQMRAGVQALAYWALRRLGMARWLREQLVPRTPPAAVDALLRTALALAWKQPDGADNAAADAGSTHAGNADADNAHHAGAAAQESRTAACAGQAAAAAAASARSRHASPVSLAGAAGHVAAAHDKSRSAGQRAVDGATPFARGACVDGAAHDNALHAAPGHVVTGHVVPEHAAPQGAVAASSRVLSQDAASYNDFTLVHQAVEAARRHPRMRYQAALVNACLRAFVRERAVWQERCRQAAPQGRAELLNLPHWWWQRLQADYPDAPAETAGACPVAEAAATTATTDMADAACAAKSSTALAARVHAGTAAGIALAGQSQPPLHLRVNARCMTPACYLQEHLLPAGLAGQLHGAHGILLRRPFPVQQLPGFAQGWVSVQDAAAQLAAPLLLHALQALQVQLDTKAGAKAEAKVDANAGVRLRLLDACAAPGGKTAHLLELGEHEVTALDIDAERCARITENLQRLGLQAQVLAADASYPDTWWNGQPFDGILLDAPCCASGIVRRHPDIAWLRREQDIARLAQTQQHLLQALWPLLRPGGVLLYATCSVFRAEGQAQIDAFLSRHTDAAPLPAPGHLLPKSLPQDAALVQNGPSLAPNHAEPLSAQTPCAAPLLDHDGFYYALLAKNV